MLTQFDVHSKEFCRNGNPLWDQTKEEFVALCHLDHLCTNWCAIYKVAHCFPRTLNQSHHDGSNVKLTAERK